MSLAYVIGSGTAGATSARILNIIAFSLCSLVEIYPIGLFTAESLMRRMKSLKGASPLDQSKMTLH